MGFAQAIVCDGGCGARVDVPGSRTAGGSVVTIPEGWHVRNIGSEATFFESRGLRVITVCPDCWGTKTLAEVLGALRLEPARRHG